VYLADVVMHFISAGKQTAKMDNAKQSKEAKMRGGMRLTVLKLIYVDFLFDVILQ